MRKLIFTLAFLGLLGSSFASYYNPVTVNEVRALPGGRVFFQATGFATDRYWVFDVTTAAGKNMFTLLVAAKSSNQAIRFESGAQYTGSDAPNTANTYYVTGILIP
jgi:hypothetical protein